MEIVKSDIKNLYEQRKKYIEESNYIKAEEISQKINNYKTIQLKSSKDYSRKDKKQNRIISKKHIVQNYFNLKNDGRKKKRN